MMTEERFRILIEAYGAAPARWPEAERLAAARFAATDPAAHAILEEALKLDGLMAALPTPDMPLSLVDKVLESAAVETLVAAAAAPKPAQAPEGFWRSVRALWPLAPRWAPMGVLAGAAALGMVVGLNLESVISPEAGLYAANEQVAFRLPDDQDLANLP